jgi:hypothetical protein
MFQTVFSHIRVVATALVHAKHTANPCRHAQHCPAHPNTPKELTEIEKHVIKICARNHGHAAAAGRKIAFFFSSKRLGV